MRSGTILLTVVVAAGILSGCGFTTRRIADIQQFPGRYYDRRVSVEGRVTSAFAGPFLPVQFYKVDDGTGEITVLATSSRVPRRGAWVRVRGRVEELGSFGNRSFGLHLSQEHLTVRRY